jgi:peptidoglycan hydrolase FlgJ
MTSPLTMTSLPPQTNEKVASSKYSEAELQKLKKTCADFESIFTYQLLKTMRKTIPESKTGMNDHGKETYTMMMDQKLAESISAKGNGLGLQKVLYEQLTKTNTQEISREVKNKLK